jgi:hypothetical protein
MQCKAGVYKKGVWAIFLFSLKNRKEMNKINENKSVFLTCYYYILRLLTKVVSCCMGVMHKVSGKKKFNLSRQTLNDDDGYR